MQQMSLAHSSQALYAMASEASAVVLPYINSAVGGNVQTFAMRLNCRWRSVTSISQVLGGLCFGHYADRFGPRWALLTAHGAAMSSAILCSEPEQRSVAMGRISGSYGLGFFTGTLVTAYAARLLSPRQIAWGAVALEASVLSTVLALYPSGEYSVEEPKPAASFWEILQRPHVWSLVLSKLSTSAAGGMLLCMITQFAMDS
eukprot:g7325.t1